MLVIIFIKDIAIALMNGCENRIHFEECKGSHPNLFFSLLLPFKNQGKQLCYKIRFMEIALNFSV